MALSTAEFEAWLDNSSAIRCILVEVVASINGTDTLIYLSNKNFNTGPADTPANTTYLPLLSTGVTFNQSISLEGSASLSFGDISISNVNGELDSWLGYIWANKPISIYIGDVTFSRSDFTLIHSGYVQDVSSRDKNTLNINLRDVLQKVNTPVTSKTLGGTQPNSTSLIPLVFGEVYNITPVVVDSVNLVYQVHDGQIERIIEVRDNGVPLTENVGYTVDLSNGKFTLLNSPAGTITCSVQGEKTSIDLNTGALLLGTYTNSIAKIIGVICRKYANAKVSAQELDLNAFSAFNSTNLAPAGVYLTSTTNTIQICQELAASVGGYFTGNNLGQLTLIQIKAPEFNGVLIDDNYILENSCKLDTKLPVKGSVKLGYCKNWTVQTSLLTGIPEDHKQLLGLEYLVVSQKDVQVLTAYDLAEESAVKNTLLVSNTPDNYVSQEALRQLNIWRTPRFIYSLELPSKYLNIKLGSMITLKHSRFDLLNGAPGQVLSIQVDWNLGKITLGVLV